jgi:hypothetical protein
MWCTQYAPHLFRVNSIFSTLGITCSIFPQRTYLILLHGISNRTRLCAIYHIIFDKVVGAVTQCTIGRISLSIPNVDISLRTKITKIPCEFEGRHGSDWLLLSWNTTPCGLVDVYRRFWGTSCLRDHGRSTHSNYEGSHSIKQYSSVSVRYMTSCQFNIRTERTPKTFCILYY